MKDKKKISPELIAWSRERFERATELERLWMVAGWSHGSGLHGDSAEECKEQIQAMYGIAPPPEADKQLMTELTALITNRSKPKGDKHDS